MEDLYYNKYVKYKTKFEVLYKKMYGGGDTDCTETNLNNFTSIHINRLNYLNEVFIIINKKIEENFDVTNNIYNIKYNSELYTEIDNKIKEKTKEIVSNKKNDTMGLQYCNQKVNIEIEKEDKKEINYKINEIIKNKIKDIFNYKRFKNLFNLSDKRNETIIEKLKEDKKKILSLINSCQTLTQTQNKTKRTISLFSRNNEDSKRRKGSLILSILRTKRDSINIKINIYKENFEKLNVFINFILNKNFKLRYDVCPKDMRLLFDTEIENNNSYQNYYKMIISMLGKYEEYIEELNTLSKELNTLSKEKTKQPEPASQTSPAQTQESSPAPQKSAPQAQAQKPPPPPPKKTPPPEQLIPPSSEGYIAYKYCERSQNDVKECKQKDDLCNWTGQKCIVKENVQKKYCNNLKGDDCKKNNELCNWTGQNCIVNENV